MRPVTEYRVFRSLFGQRMLRPASNKYVDLLHWLLHVNRGRQVKLGLDNMRQLQAALGARCSDASFVTAHVAGTNGKGSVCYKLSRSLDAAGARVGLFSSPHISSFRERIRVGNTPIPEEAVEELLPPIVEACADHRVPATFFELTTLLSMSYFAHERVTHAVYEVGLGGRLDSTNVVCPDVTVITSISRDHTRLLGETIEEIALEKAGIVKAGVPLIAGPNCPHALLRDVARDRGAPYVRVPDEAATFAVDDFDLENQFIAEAALVSLGVLSPRAKSSSNGVAAGMSGGELVPPSTPDLEAKDEEAAVRAALALSPECRFQRFYYTREGGAVEASKAGPTGAGVVDDVEGTIDVVLDVAHNDDAFGRLFARLRATYGSTRRVRAVVGISSGKDTTECLAHALRLADVVYLVEADSKRAVSAAELRDAARECVRVVSDQESNGDECATPEVVCDGKVGPTVRRAVEAALTAADGDVVVVCGSFFLMTEARSELGIPQMLDNGFDLNETFPSFGGSDDAVRLDSLAK